MDVGLRRGREHPLARLSPDERRQYLSNYRLAVEHAAILPTIRVLDFLGRNGLFARPVLEQIHDALLRRAEREGIRVPDFLRKKDVSPFQKWVQSVRLVRLLLGEQPANFSVGVVRRRMYWRGEIMYNDSIFSSKEESAHILLGAGGGTRVSTLAHEDFHAFLNWMLRRAYRLGKLRERWGDFRDRYPIFAANEAAGRYKTLLYADLSRGVSSDTRTLSKEMQNVAVNYYMYYNLPASKFLEMWKRGKSWYKQEFSKISRHPVTHNFTEGTPLLYELAHVLQLSAVDRMVIDAIVNRVHSRKQMYTQIKEKRNNIFYFFNKRLPMGREIDH